MATVYIPLKYKELAERLAKRETTIGQKPIFKTYMHLFVFASMVGYSLGKKEALNNSKERGPEIEDRIFANYKLEGLAYLMALHETKNAEILRETNDNDCWRIIESYAAAGFKIIDDWLLHAATDIDGVSTLLIKIKEEAAKSIRSSNPEAMPEIEF
jgi:dnd system-associated protein 4